MKTTWFKGLSPQQKEEMRLIFNGNKIFRDKAIEIMKDKIASSDNQSTIESSYDNPNWALKQADSIGYKRALNELISIFS